MVDSGSKHIIMCKTATDFMQDDKAASMDELIRNKKLYATHQNDIVLGISAKGAINYPRSLAYPLVVSKIPLSSIFDAVSKDADDFHPTAQNYVDTLHFKGIALTEAYAHPRSGDTVGSVLIGGLRTIRNGPFQINSGK
jgi:hypothetical protein